jgi:hypothetical protein
VRQDMSRSYLAAAVVLGAALLVAALPASAGGPFQFHSLTPCRVVDTRNANQSQRGYGPALTSGERRQFPIQGNCLVPVGAKAVTLNLTAVQPGSQGNLGLYPSQDPPPPNTSTINFTAGTYALANGAIVPLADQAVYAKDLTVRAYLQSGGTVHVLIDVTGYFTDVP